MNYKAVLAVIAYMLLILSLCLLAPLSVALIYDFNDPREVQEVLGFGLTSFVSLLLGLILRTRYRAHVDEIGRREAFAVVSFSWLLAVVLGMIPYLFSGVLSDPTDAFFETMSGFTTTGATVFGGPGLEIERIPRCIQFWRCMTQWLGGMGIVVLGVALLSFLKVGGYTLLKAETPGGVAFERERPKVSEIAKELWKLYLALSVLEVLVLLLLGMNVYDSLCHTFTTMSTGGFSPYSESIARFGPAIQWAIIAFMFLAGSNFSLHAQVARGKFGAPLHNPEFRVYASIMLTATLVCVWAVPNAATIEQGVRTAAFQVVSIGTTTGYATTDFDKWPAWARLVLLLLMFTGGCMGSTGGGVKAARILVYAKVIFREIARLILPRAVIPIRVGRKVVDESLVSNIMAFGFAYLACFLLGTMVMAAYEYDLVTCISASAAALGNIGPGLAKVGPMENWYHLPGPAKWVMSSLMLLGRLEIFSVLALFSSWTWKR